MKKPNILFLFTDDQRFNTIGAVNNPQIHTPTMDFLVSKGTFFSQAYIPGGTCAAVCMPSRAMVHTGRGLFSIANNGESIPKEHILMGEYLRTAGYDTFGTGKWHNGTESFTRSFSAGDNIFFGGMDDHWNVPVCRFQADGNYPSPVPHPWDGGTGEIVEIPKSFNHINRGKHSTDIFCDTVADYLLTSKKENPFFIYLSFMAPHDPRTMPTRYQTMYNPKNIVIPPNYMPQHPFDNGELDVRDEKLAEYPRNTEEIQKHIAEYYGMISHLDGEMGKVLDALKASGEYENTIIILAGDNGLALGSHGLMGKQNLYDHSIHIPLSFSGPGIPGGRNTNAYCYLYDIFPTLCDLLEIDIPDTVEGKSLYPVIQGETDSHRGQMLFAYRDIQRGYLQGNMKLITYLVNNTFTIQLFNILVDPLELKDLSDLDEYKPLIHTLVRHMIEEMGQQADFSYNKWKEAIAKIA